MRGYVTGALWGVLIVGGGLAGVSLWAPLPETAQKAATPVVQTPQEAPIDLVDALAVPVVEAPVAQEVTPPRVILQPQAAKPSETANDAVATELDLAPDSLIEGGQSEPLDAASDMLLPEIPSVSGSDTPQIAAQEALPSAQPLTSAPTLDFSGTGGLDLVGAPEPKPELSLEEGQLFLPAVQAYAEPFENPLNKPLFSIVLIDSPESRLDRTVLTSFNFPVTFAINPENPNAAEAAKAYRDAGFEVVMTADGLPQSGTPQEWEVAFEASLQLVPQSVAMIDGQNSFLQRTPEALKVILDNLSVTGHGFLGYPERLNVGERTALSMGIPAETFYRHLDADKERASVIKRYLDRATFHAGQNGSVVVIGTTYAETITALYAWQQSSRSDTVVPAPLSAVLKQKLSQ